MWAQRTAARMPDATHPHPGHREHNAQLGEGQDSGEAGQGAPWGAEGRAWPAEGPWRRRGGSRGAETVGTAGVRGSLRLRSTDVDDFRSVPGRGPGGLGTEGATGVAGAGGTA